MRHKVDMHWYEKRSIKVHQLNAVTVNLTNKTEKPKVKHLVSH